MNFAPAKALFLLAQDGGGPFGGIWGIMTLWLPIIFVFWFLLIRPQRQEQARRLQMLQAVKKNDRVITTGGIYGVVTNVHREADEVTVKVDEATNTKLRVTMGSIARVLGDDTSESSPSK
ncbi:MAG: preprotein translocase subunit YajC [Rhodopirellula sp.]|nr:preprotein translocase subunit YajC [Rhodopirellula sp.]